MQLAHFYHCYAAGAWRDPLAEHLAALEYSYFDGPFHVGIVGSARQRAEVLDELAVIRPPDRVYTADTGWEQVTLRPLRLYARRHDGAVLYAHTKGASAPSATADAWRREMTHHLVREWQQALRQIRSGADAVGCHWLEPGDYPAGVASARGFAGNFWIATCAHLRRLAACPTRSRHDAEAWIGSRKLRTCDLAPGWPERFAPVRFGRLVASR